MPFGLKGSVEKVLGMSLLLKVWAVFCFVRIHRRSRDTFTPFADILVMMESGIIVVPNENTNRNKCKQEKKEQERTILHSVRGSKCL